MGCYSSRGRNFYLFNYHVHNELQIVWDATRACIELLCLAPSSWFRMKMLASTATKFNFCMYHMLSYIRPAPTSNLCVESYNYAK